MKRFLKRNCIKIPFYLIMIGLIVFASQLERTVETPTTDFTIPPGVYEVFAETIPEEPVEVEPLTTPEEIGEKYCPDTASEWAEVVRGLI